MRIDMKAFGVRKHFNGIDIHQTRNYIKITCEKYIHNMLKEHNWLDISNTATKPTPLPSHFTYIMELENAIQPNTLDEQLQLKSTMGFNYRQVIGEVIYPMMKCWPDISFHATKLS